MNDQTKTGKVMLYAAWLGVLGLLTLAFGVWEKDRFNPNSQPTSHSEGNIKTVILQRNAFNHYLSSGKINGDEVLFLLDTGATDVAIPGLLAKKLGLKKGASGYATTAAGRVQVFRSHIDTLEIGNIRLNNVRASINPSMDGEEILLGMSALGQLRFTQQGDILELQQVLQ